MRSVGEMPLFPMPVGPDSCWTELRGITVREALLAVGVVLAWQGGRVDPWEAVEVGERLAGVVVAVLDGYRREASGHEQ